MTRSDGLWRQFGIQPWRCETCPVTGSRSGAEAGTLSAFIHSSADDHRARRVLDTFVATRYDIRVPGHPTQFKFIYNAWGATLLHSFASFIPAMRDLLADDFEVARRIVTRDGWMALVCASKLDRMLGEQFESPDFALRDMVKDCAMPARSSLNRTSSSPPYWTGTSMRRSDSVALLTTLRSPAEMHPDDIPGRGDDVHRRRVDACLDRSAEFSQPGLRQTEPLLHRLMRVSGAAWGRDGVAVVRRLPGPVR